MAILIPGDNAIFNALIYGNGNNSGQEYMSMVNTQFMNSISPELYAYYSNINNTVYGGIDQSAAMNQLRTMGHYFNEAFQVDGVFYYTTIEEFHMANQIMQRWMMANPDVRQLYYQGVIDGWSDTYVDHYPKLVGNDHYDYRVATNGIDMMNANGEYEMTQWTQYVAPEDENLSFEEQHAILSSWGYLMSHIEKKMADPTSIWGSNMQV